MSISPSGAIVWRDFVTDGVPASGAEKPAKAAIRAWSEAVETRLDAVSTAAKLYPTRATLYANLTEDANTLAWVIGDPDVANNGIYMKNGASGSGSWTRVADLPFSFIVATDAGAGSPNAIQATSSIPVTGSALVWMSIFEANTSSPVTVSFNGGPALTVKTNSGNDVVAGGLIAGMIIMGIVSGSTFRLISDQASAAIVAAAEAAAAEAADYAEYAKNNWVVSGPFVGTGVEADYLLAVDPGSTNNMFVVVGGVSQLISHGAYALVYIADLPYIRINVPDGVPFEVRTGNAIDVLTPADGSVTYDKMQNASSSAVLLGRKSAGAGVFEEISRDDLRDEFLPAGSVVQRIYAQSAATPSGTQSIPLDGTKPQISEGFQVISAAITPRRATNTLRITASGWVLGSGACAAVIAVFHELGGSVDAVQAQVFEISAATPVAAFTLVVEIPCTSVAARNISVRAGNNNGATLTINSLLGGGSVTVLIIEEIKGA